MIDQEADEYMKLNLYVVRLEVENKCLKNQLAVEKEDMDNKHSDLRFFLEVIRDAPAAQDMEYCMRTAALALKVDDKR